MVFADSAMRLAASLLAIAQTRIQLAATEVEEESVRYFSYLMMSLATMFCLGMAIALAALLLVVLYWDTHRVGILLTLIAAFGIAGAVIGLQLRARYRAKPRLLGGTLDELAHDNQMLHPRA